MEFKEMQNTQNREMIKTEKRQAEKALKLQSLCNEPQLKGKKGAIKQSINHKKGENYAKVTRQPDLVTAACGKQKYCG